MNEPKELDEFDVRQYFMNAPLAEALTTHAICEGILLMRQLQQNEDPKTPQCSACFDVGCPACETDEEADARGAGARKDEALLLAFDKGEKS